MQPLHQAFLHFPGIGHVRRQQLLDAGIQSWQDVKPEHPATMRKFNALWEQLYAFAQSNLQAEAQQNWLYFAQNLVSEDRWRLLQRCWNLCVYLDIETGGFEYDAPITVISCWNGHEVKLFVNGENLDEFPDYLLTVPFLVTFNGTTFDLPVIKRHFNLPEIPVPHVDMRWVCYNCTLTGGLKAIEHKLQLQRPGDLVGTDGNEAIMLWNQWKDRHEAAARNKLLRYCAADTIALQHVAAVILRQQANAPQAFPTNREHDWQLLNEALPPMAVKHPEITAVPSSQPVTAPVAEAPSGSSPLLETNLKERLQRFLNQKKR